MVQGGDIEGGDGSGAAKGIYGGGFTDEEAGPELYHDRPGLLGMANSGPNTNGTQFYITTAAASWLDGEHVIFGEVLEGKEVILAIERLATPSGDPQKRIEVVDCGELRS
mmetsp:Transcript_41010/g.131881  ORF Transcript_41010/g.131881 Transcript_41010/m.131881 type:complete len:110 (+) Transcript_41010:477-806(+)